MRVITVTRLIGILVVRVFNSNNAHACFFCLGMGSSISHQSTRVA